MESNIERFFGGSIPIQQSLNSLLGGSMQLNSFPNLSPQLVVLSQGSHSEEVISKNGIQKTVHIVVKNSPFHIQLGVANGSSCNFNQIAFESQLVYDCEGEKEVDFVKVKPMEFKATASENGQLLDCECRIKVLTSQHEDSLFRIRIIGSNPITHEEIPGLRIVSGSIKVISKPEQLKKKQGTNKKRTLTDMLIETVTRIEKKQEEQQKLIERIIQQQSDQVNVIQDKKQKQNNVQITQEITGTPTTVQTPIINNNTTVLANVVPPVTTSTTPVTTPLQNEFLFNPLTIQQEQQQQQLEIKKVNDFEEAFVQLIRSFTTMKPEERPEMIRKIIRTSSTRDTERLSELLDLLWTEGLQKDYGRRDRIVHNSNQEEGCTCLDCPHKSELERIDLFYKEFLSTGSSFTDANF